MARNYVGLIKNNGAFLLFITSSGPTALIVLLNTRTVFVFKFGRICTKIEEKKSKCHVTMVLKVRFCVAFQWLLQK